MSNQGFKVDLTVDVLSQSVIKDRTLPEGWENLAEKCRQEMPGIKQLVAEYTLLMPLKGIRISGCHHVTTEVLVCIEAYISLGAELRWCSSNPFSTSDHVAAYLTLKYPDKLTLFAWKGESVEEYLWCIYQTLSWPNNRGPHTIHDDGCTSYIMLHYGMYFEKQFEKTGKKEDENCELKFVETPGLLRLLNRVLDKNPRHWHNVASELIGVTEQTTSGVTAFRHFYKTDGVLATVFCANNSITKSKFDNIYGSRQSVVDSFMRATHIMISGREVVVIGYGQVGRGTADAFRGLGARVRVTEIDPICALQASMHGYDVVLLEDVLETADVFITTTGSINNILVKHILKMKNGAVLGNMGQGSIEINVDELSKVNGIKKLNIMPFVDKYVLPNGNGIIVLADGRLMNLSCANGHPSFVLSTSLCSQILSQIEVAKNLNHKEYDKVLVTLPKIVDEKIARLHLKHLNIKLTVLTKEQADFMGVNIDGPYKEEGYPY